MAQRPPRAAGGAHLHPHLQRKLPLTLPLICARIHQPLMLQPGAGRLQGLLKALEALIEHRMGLAVAIGEPVEARWGGRAGKAGLLHG